MHKDKPTLTPKNVEIIRKHLTNQGKTPTTLRAAVIKELTYDKIESNPENLELLQWIDYVAFFIAPLSNDKSAAANVLSELDSFLSTRSYFVSNRYGVADTLVFLALKSVVANLNNADHEKYLNLIRWYSHIQAVSNQTVANRDRINFPLLFTGSSSSHGQD